MTPDPRPYVDALSMSAEDEPGYQLGHRDRRGAPDVRQPDVAPGLSRGEQAL